MSSDSEIDEFYDAEDVSPAKIQSLPDINEVGENRLGVDKTLQENTQGETSSLPDEVDVEEEEKRLLKEKQLAEERRKAEDAEYERRLEEIKRRKQEEDQKQDAARKVLEAQDRMHKLQQMRGVIIDETTPTRPSSKPSCLETEGGEHRDSTDCESAQQLVDQVCAKTCELSLSSPSTSSYSQAANMSRELPSQAGLCPASTKPANNLNKSNSAEEKVMSKNIPELLKDKTDSDMDKLRVTPERESGAQARAQGQEPDIIQSTKSKSADSTAAQPVAPPRRRKKKAPSPPPAESVTGQHGNTKMDKGRPQGLPVDLATPRHAVDSMAAQLDQSLDLKSATCGIRHVTAAEEDATKGEGRDSVYDLETASVASSETIESSWSTEVNKAISVKTISTSQEEPPLLLRDQHIKEETEKELEKLQKSNSINRAKSNSLRLEKSDSFKMRHSALTKEKSNSLNREKCDKEGNAFDSKLEKSRSLDKSQDSDMLGMQRPRSNSGRLLTDKEILESVQVLNLDTGERIPLSAAEERLPQCLNPLALHIMRRTKEYSSDSSLTSGRHNEAEQPGDKDITPSASKTLRSVKPIKKRTIKLKKLFSKIKTKAEGVRHGEESSSDEDELADGRRMIKIKASHSHKGPYDFDLLVPVQEVRGDNSGAVWTMKFSHCGKLLAVGGQDNLLRIWVLRDSYQYFDDMRQKYSEATKVSPAPSQDSLNSISSETSSVSNNMGGVHGGDEEDEHAPFMRRPFCIYKGHTADLLDISWSKNYFILSSSMDKTVRLWHVSRRECLCCFQHIDFVTAIAFHPKDDRYFLSGSLDGKLRLWNIPEKKVALWNEVTNNTLITAANFCLNGQFAVVGTYDGRCIFYNAEHLKYFTQIHVRSTRGKNARGRKVTGVEPVPGEDKIMVTSNDSRIRLYDLRDLTLTCKYRGCANNSSQIKASFSSNGKYIICGSEDHFVYIWRTQHNVSTARKDRNDFWEGIRAHQAVVTSAIFAPNPGLIIKPQFEFVDSDTKDEELQRDVRGEVLVSADFSGAIKVFINKFKPGSG